MAATNHAQQNARQQAQQAARKVNRNEWVERLARLGYFVRGLIYAVIGLLAIQVAIGKHGQVVDQQGAIATLARQPYGTALLWFTVIGLAGYALWGIVRAVFDPLHKGKDLKGLVTRAGYLVSAFSYGALMVAAYRTIQGASGGAQNGAQSAQSQQMASTLLAQSWGRVVIGVIGLAMIGWGLSQIYAAWKRNMDVVFKPYALPKDERKWAMRLGRFGTAARGVVFAILGAFFVQAALYADPHRVRGLDGALAALAGQPYGVWLLGIVAAGLLAFGIYSMFTGVWFRLSR